MRRTKWNIPDLYAPDGIYWFWRGVNWRALLSYFLGMVWVVPDFIMAVGSPRLLKLGTTCTRSPFSLDMRYLGLSYLLNLLFPPPGLGEQVNIHFAEGSQVVMGVAASRHGPTDAGTEDLARPGDVKVQRRLHFCNMYQK